MTLCDNLILMYSGLYPYNHVLLKWRGTLGEVRHCPEAQVGKFRGIWELVLSDLQVPNRWLLFRLVLWDWLGEGSSRTKDFPPPIWMSKELVFWRILLGKGKRPWKVAVPFTKIHVQLSSWIPLPPCPPAGKKLIFFGDVALLTASEGVKQKNTHFFFLFLTWRAFYFYGFHVSWKAK